MNGFQCANGSVACSIKNRILRIGLWAAYKMYEEWGKIPAAGGSGIGNVEAFRA